jgi:hypothetical protein
MTTSSEGKIKFTGILVDRTMVKHGGFGVDNTAEYAMKKILPDLARSVSNKCHLTTPLDASAMTMKLYPPGKFCVPYNLVSYTIVSLIH